MLSRHHLVALFALSPFLPMQTLLAHSSDHTPVSQSNVRTTAAFSYRTEGELDGLQAFTIPGVLMGGEAFPGVSGVALDDAQLYGLWVSPSQYTLQASLAAHPHNGSTSLELEELWLEYTINPKRLDLRLSTGKMTTQTTQLASFHASQSAFSEASLLSDVFWGRHFSSTGLRLSKIYQGFEAGLEYFNGDAWPATVGEQNTSAYLHYNAVLNNAQFFTGFWGMQSQAHNRQDTRYDNGHQHGNSNSANTPLTEYLFSGNIQTAGGFAELRLLNGLLPWHIKFEATQQESDGVLTNTTQSALLNSTIRGIRFETGLQHCKHELQLSIDRLIIDNRFTGDAGSLFVINAGLMNNNIEPNKLTVAWNYSWLTGLSLRAEAIQEQVYNQERQQRFNLGLKWNQKWLF